MITILKRTHVLPLLLTWIRLIALVQMTHYHRDEKRKDLLQKTLATSILPAHLYSTDSYGFYTQYRKMSSLSSSSSTSLSSSTTTTNSNINMHDNNDNDNNNEQQLYAIFNKQSLSEEYAESYHDNINSATNDTTMIKINRYHPPIFHIQQPQQQQHQPHHNNQQHHQHMIISTCQTVCACKWKGGKQTVECIDRLLSKIPDNIDGSTQVLDMSGNKFHTLLNEQFIRANLLNLQKLYLRNCQIIHIEMQTFKGLTNLVELDLSYNSLKTVPSKALNYLSSLRDLTLSSNRINKIEPNAFAGILALHKLDLSHCDLHEISGQAFDGLDDLTLLRLNGNKLNELLPETIETLSRLHGIELHDNPWICDCRLRDAKLWLMEKNIPYPVAPMCSGGPDRFIERTFNDLNINDFACRPEMLAISHFIEAATGENASILCRAKAIPEPNISWYWNGRLLSNNTVFSSHQHLLILEYGTFVKMSRLLLTNAQEIDSSEFYCVAENRAGTAESNFTLHVRMRAIGMESLSSRHIIGLSATLMGLIVFVLVFILFLAMRLRRENYAPNKSSNHLEVITNMNHHQNMVINKPQVNVVKNSTSGTTLSNCITSKNNLNDTQLDTQLDKKDTGTGTCSVSSTNPLQKPPRLIDMSYVNNSYDKSTSLLATSSGIISPTTSIGNNPDLINDTKRFENDEYTNLKIPTTNLTQNLFGDFSASTGNGDYKEMDNGNSSLYPSTLWEDLLTTPSICTSSADDIFLRRYTDKTPILEMHHQLYDNLNSTINTQSFSKTFPRVSCGTNIVDNETAERNVLSLEGSDSTASTTTTNLSNSGSIALMAGYPNDYGLPLVPGAELQYNHHLQRHALRDPSVGIGGTRIANFLEYEVSGNSSTYNNKNKQMNPRHHYYRQPNGLPALISRTLPRHKDTTGVVGSFFTSTITSNLDNLNSVNLNSKLPIQNVHNSGSDKVTNIENGGEVNNQIINSKTIRVWQKGGVPVLPPLSAIKRALISNNRNNSPDEGYQEGCGTNV